MFTVNGVGNEKKDKASELAPESGRMEDSSSADDDSDKELQVALEEGLLKSDRLNYVTEKKRPPIYKTEALLEKAKQLEKNLPWLETLDVTVDKEEIVGDDIEDDFKREVIFYKQAQSAVRQAALKLSKMGEKIFRPKDYYAEMAKSDEHMQKVRQRMADIREGKERQDLIRRLREEKKFSAKLQKKAVEERHKEKRLFLEEVKKHRKGMKSQLETMLNNAKRLQVLEEDDRNVEDRRGKQVQGRKRKFSRAARNKKFGFGGQKKRGKMNDRESYEGFTSGSKSARRSMSARQTSKKSKRRGR